MSFVGTDVDKELKDVLKEVVSAGGGRSAALLGPADVCRQSGPHQTIPCSACCCGGGVTSV